MHRAAAPLPRPSLDDWRRAIPGLKRVGDEWHGPCPVCGGADRFWVTRGRAHECIAACRHRCDFARILEAAGLMADRRRAAESAHYRRGGGTKQAAYAPSNHAGGGNVTGNAPYAPPDDAHGAAARRIDTATAIWEAAREMEATPAARYLRDHRRVWPDGIAFPAAARWLEKRAAPPWLQGGKSGLPDDAAGAIAFRFIDGGGALSAVTLDALTADGARAEDPRMPGGRWRKAYGVCMGACMTVGMRGGAPVVVVEGEVTALAAVWLASPAAQVMASGGAPFLRALMPMLARANRPVEVWADNDAPGRDAACRLAGGLRRAAAAAIVRYDFATDAAGSDAADALQAVIDATGWPAHARRAAANQPR